MKSVQFPQDLINDLGIPNLDPESPPENFTNTLKQLLAFSRFNETSVSIFWEYYTTEATYRDLASKYGVSPQQASQVVHSVKRFFRKGENRKALIGDGIPESKEVSLTAHPKFVYPSNLLGFLGLTRLINRTPEDFDEVLEYIFDTYSINDRDRDVFWRYFKDRTSMEEISKSYDSVYSFTHSVLTRIKRKILTAPNIRLMERGMCALDDGSAYSVEDSISDMPISHKACSTLERNQIHTVKDLISCGATKVKHFKYMGGLLFEEVADALSTYYGVSRSQWYKEGEDV